jgi:hypothetical protein
VSITSRGPLRNVILEIDKMEGTEFPPTSVVDSNGKTHTLKGIYSEVGVNLDIKKDQDDIPDLAGPDDVYTDAELQGLMTSNRNPLFRDTGDRLSAYLVVVTNYDTDGVLGVMFDTERRLGCAVFYGHDMIRTDPKAFMRTSAHELGHQFNLHHEDGTTSQNIQ